MNEIIIYFFLDTKIDVSKKKRKSRFSKKNWKLKKSFNSKYSSYPIHHHIKNPNIQSDEANNGNIERKNEREDTNGNWIPYDDHRNALEHGSGDIILLLDDTDEQSVGFVEV